MGRQLEQSNQFIIKKKIRGKPLKDGPRVTKKSRKNKDIHERRQCWLKKKNQVWREVLGASNLGQGKTGTVREKQTIPVGGGTRILSEKNRDKGKHKNVKQQRLEKRGNQLVW